MMPTPHGRIVLFTASLSLALLGLQSDTPSGGHPPSTRAGDVKESFGNVEIADPYRWLEEQNAPETRAWIDEQNKYSEAFLRAFPGRDAIQRRVTELLKIDTIGVPQEHGGATSSPSDWRTGTSRSSTSARAPAARTRSSSIRIRSLPTTGRRSRSWT
jgi:protease II